MRVVTVVVLFAVLGSETELAMLGEFVMVVVPVGVMVALTLTTRGKLTMAPTASVCPELSVQVNVPVPPTAMVLQVQPGGAVKSAPSVVLAGMVSVKVTVVIGAVEEAVIAVGPLLVIDCV